MSIIALTQLCVPPLSTRKSTRHPDSDGTLTLATESPGIPGSPAKNVSVSLLHRPTTLPRVTSSPQASITIFASQSPGVSEQPHAETEVEICPTMIRLLIGGGCGPDGSGIGYLLENVQHIPVGSKNVKPKYEEYRVFASTYPIGSLPENLPALGLIHLALK